MTTETAHSVSQENGWEAREGFRKGTENDIVSKQWRNRSDDERFLDLDSIYSARKASADQREETIIDKTSIRLIPDGSGEIRVGVGDNELVPTHWSFSQLSSLVGAPPSFLRKLSPTTATQAFNESWENKYSGLGDLKAYRSEDGIHAVTSRSYGRLYDWQVIESVQEIAGNGRGDKNWKVPGVLDWNTGRYDPNKPVTRGTTTLFGSDRDVFLFLVDDTRPIKVGTMPSGDPDNVFRGFYVWNSEVGSTSVGCATFLLRGVCGNRILWGCENHQEIRMRHNLRTPGKYLREIAPALKRYSEASESDVQIGIQNARNAVVVESVEDRVNYLVKRQFSKDMAKKIVDTHIAEESFAPVNVWDFVQAITAYAKKTPHQDKRLVLEKRAARLMATV